MTLEYQRLHQQDTSGGIPAPAPVVDRTPARTLARMSDPAMPGSIEYDE